MPDYGSHMKVCPPKTVSNLLIHALKEENEQIDFEKERTDNDFPIKNDLVSAKSQAFRILKEKYEQLKLKVAKSKQSLLKAIVLVEGLEKGNDELKAQLEAKKKRSEREILAGIALIKENEQLKAEIKDVQQSHSMLTTTKEELQARVRQLERTKRELEETNLELKGDLKLGIKEARATRNELESSVRRLEGENCKLKRELLMESMHGPRRGEDLAAGVRRLEDENPLLHRIWSNLAVKCEYCTEGCAWTGSVSDYESHQKSCPRKKEIQRIKDMEANLENIRASETQLKIEKDRVTRELSKVTSMKDTLKTGNRELKNQLQTEKKNQDELKRKISEVTATKETLENGNRELKNQLQTEKKNQDELKKKISEVTATKETLENGNRELKNQLQTEKKNRDELKKKISEVTATKETLENGNRELKNQLQTEKKKRDELKEKNVQLIREMNDVNQRLDALSTKSDGLSRDLELQCSIAATTKQELEASLCQLKEEKQQEQEQLIDEIQAWVMSKRRKSKHGS